MNRGRVFLSDLTGRMHYTEHYEVSGDSNVVTVTGPKTDVTRDVVGLLAAAYERGRAAADDAPNPFRGIAHIPAPMLVNQSYNGEFRKEQWP